MKRIVDLGALIKRFELIAKYRKSKEAEKFLSELHPADIADISDDLNETDLKYLFDLLDDETASEVLSELEEPTLDELIDILGEEKLANLVKELPDDDAADIIATFPTDIQNKLLNRLDSEEKEDIQELMKYPEESAGGIMTGEYVSITKEATVQDAIEHIRKASEEVEDIMYVYVVDDEGVLVGIVSLVYLIKSDPKKKCLKMLSAYLYTWTKRKLQR